MEQEKDTAAAEERGRLARDLHDAVTQTIYSASLIAQVLPQIWDRNPDEGKRNLVKLRQLVRGALGEMRTLLFELRPSALETADLETLLHQLGDTLTGRTRIPVELTVEGEDPPPVEVKIVLYRVAQEAFNNIAKHAEATRVEVHLQTRQNRVELKIRDYGRGFEIKSISSEHMGIRIMQERAETVGAQVELESAPGTGTTVKVEWNQTNDDKGQRMDDQD